MKDIIELTMELIRYQTVASKPDELARCADFIEDWLRRCGAPVQRRNTDGIPSLLCLPEDGRCRVLLMAHMDVVDAPADMFEPRESDGKLFGRGALDDKYAVALSMVMLRAYLEKAVRSGGSRASLPFGILITGDEEIGGGRGAKPILADIEAEFCIALDGGQLDKIVVKSKGLMQLKLVSRGKAAHGARPWLGENAIEKLIEDYVRIRPLFEDGDPAHWHRTLNFSVVHAGGSVNRVPDLAEARFDIRYTEHDDVDDLLRQMGERVRGEITVEKREPMFFGGPSPHLDLLLEIAAGTRTGKEHGASDARFLSSHGIPGIVWGADGDMSQHSLDEHVNIESVFRLYRLLDRFFDRVAAAR